MEESTMLQRYIPVMKPNLPREKYIKKYVKLMEKNQIYSNYGPLVEELENRFSEYFGVEKELVVLCANATIAIQGTAYLMPIQKFHVPSFTFPASITGVLNSGKEVQIDDISLSDWKINSRDEDSADGIVEVLPFGAPLKMRENAKWDYKIIDAAASIGSEPFYFQEMQTNWVTIFSLHATKIMGIGEGGIAVFKSKNFAQEFRSWINFGFNGERNSVLAGINGKMSEITAAYGHAVLDNWAQEKVRRIKLKEKIDKVSSDLSIESITSSYPGVNPYWIADLKDSQTANRIERFLALNDVETRRWWSFGCHKMPAFVYFADKRQFPNTETVSERTLGLPMFVEMTDKQITYIHNCIQSALSAS
jgi:dTDP-4-amino-4,6-dideoxygalactose transaminase